MAIDDTNAAAAAYYAVTDAFKRSYDDPELWFRLEPKIREQVIATIGMVVGTTVPDYETYRDKIGFLRGLEWVLKEAAYLTRRHEDD